MREVAFRVGECVATPRGFVAEIVSLTDGRAQIRYLGTHRHLGEIELDLATLRPATQHDRLLAGIEARDRHTPEPRSSPVEPPPKRQWPRRRPHGDDHSEWRSVRNHSRPPARNDFEAQAREAVADFMGKHRKRDDGEK